VLLLQNSLEDLGKIARSSAYYRFRPPTTNYIESLAYVAGQARYIRERLINSLKQQQEPKKRESGEVIREETKTELELDATRRIWW